eukprot:SAG11_NODE_47_length_20431_cov_7.472752_10_plen_149_part_00
MCSPSQVVVEGDRALDARRIRVEDAALAGPFAGDRDQPVERRGADAAVQHHAAARSDVRHARDHRVVVVLHQPHEVVRDVVVQQIHVAVALDWAAGVEQPLQPRPVVVKLLLEAGERSLDGRPALRRAAHQRVGQRVCHDRVVPVEVD